MADNRDYSSFEAHGIEVWNMFFLHNNFIKK